MKFFLDAGIPPDSSAQYAVTFETNRMGLDMLMDLDKEYLRDLNITALGDIISILKHAKGASAKKAADEVLLSDIDNRSEKQTSVERSKDIKKPKPASASQNVKNPNRKESFVLSKRLGLQLPESDSDPPSPAVDTSKSVFSRLGDQQSDDSEVDTKDSVAKLKSNSPVAGKRPNVGVSGSIFERLGPESDKMGRGKMELSPQEARVTSTTSTTPDSTMIHPTRGILKKRGTGDGAGLVKSKSASNIISLKPTAVKDLKKKRISFGENEIKTMEPKPDIKSRLGYGKCASPPPPEISEPSLKTEIKKIAIGGGRFEMRKVMKVVNADKTIASELGRHSEGQNDRTGKSQELMENLSIAVKNDVKPVRKQLQVAIKNDYADAARKREHLDDEEYKVDKVDLALRAAKLKVARNQAKAMTTTEAAPRKRLAKYETKADGTVEKQYISYDDPILDVVPIKKAKSEELDQMIQKTEQLKMKSLGKSPVKISKDRMATNFQVIRNASSSTASQSTHVTLAQKAVMARSKQESFQTLASRATSVQQKRSHSPEEKSMKASGAKMDERKPSLKARLDDSSTWRREETRASKSPSKSIKDRMGSRDRVSSMEQSPVTLKDRIGSRERSPGSGRGSRERSPGRQDSSRQRLSSSSGEKKIFSRLGPRESL